MRMKTSKKICMVLSLLLTLTMLTCFAQASQVNIFDQELEPNDSVDDANIIQLGQPVSGSLPNNSDADKYLYVPDANKFIHFLFIPQYNDPNANISFFIYDKTTNTILLNPTTSHQVFEADYLFRYNHKYIIVFTVANVTNTIPYYQFSISGQNALAQVTTENRNEVEVNNTLELANIMPDYGYLYSGAISSSSDGDYFTYQYTESTDKDMRFYFFPGTTANYYIFVYDYNNITQTGQYITEGYIKNRGNAEHTDLTFHNNHTYTVYMGADSATSNSPYNFMFMTR